ncbi:arsinothricin resistance N-acetyltransferase ArsN1 family A [Cytobacillus sp. Hz8]|uniref:arsinothricin resistance N-acetyltransferase ArsN1 family A n=1 Tax=Cytobacillus sp. Hz8 TaxID=3347168 RepID=UPI0035DFE3F9
METHINIRNATKNDLKQILDIYNEGIEDKIATLEENLKDLNYMQNWFEINHNQRYAVIVAEDDHEVVGWASLNRYSNRCAYDGVAELSIYIKRSFRGRGIGSFLLREIEHIAMKNQFNKMILFTFPFNELGQGLYRKRGYREVGIFKNQGKLDDHFVDVMIMEKLFAK